VNEDWKTSRLTAESGKGAPLSPADLSRLAGRIVRVSFYDQPACSYAGTIEVRDVAGDQEGPSLAVIVEDSPARLHVVTVPLTGAQMASLMASNPTEDYHLTVHFPSPYEPRN
jgi:hypothetical protein